MKKLAIVVLAVCAMFVFMAEHSHAHETPKPPSEPQGDVAVDNSQGFSYGGYKEHIAVSGLAGLVCSTHIYPREDLKAFGCAMVPGVIKEVIDSRSKNNYFSGKDLLADAIGAALGVYTGGLLLSYNERTKTTTVAISIPLQ